MFEPDLPTAATTDRTLYQQVLEWESHSQAEPASTLARRGGAPLEESLVRSDMGALRGRQKGLLFATRYCPRLTNQG